MSQYTAWIGRIEESLIELEQVVARVVHLCDKAVETGDDDYWDGVALNLHGFYGGVEHIFEDIARTMDESIPGGADWHRGLLLQMSAEIPEIRPPVIDRATRLCLDEYRGFRHVVRNVYTFHLRPARLQELTATLPVCFQAICSDLNKFIVFLKQLNGVNLSMD